MGQDFPALVADGYTSFKVYMTYDDVKLTDREILDSLAAARREQAMLMIHAENSDCIAWLTERLELEGHDGGQVPRHVAAVRRRARGDAPRHLARRAARRADAAGPRLGQGGDARDPARPGARPQGLWRDLPAIPVPERGGLREAGRRGQQVRLLAAAARHREPGAHLDRAQRQHLPGAVVRPRRLQVRRPARQEAARRRQELPQDPQRRARRGDPPAAAVLRGRQQGPHHPAAVRGAVLDQCREDLRPASAQGHDRGRRRCRHRAVGSRRAR